MKTTIFILLSLFFLNPALLRAQTEKNYRDVPIQITLVPPLGTNGIFSGDVVNRFSLNILGGYAAGLKGVELGGFTNINRDFMTGAQFAGFSNITGGIATGVQFAGFCNINGGPSEVAQFSGFANINNGAVMGLQSAGFMNLAIGDSKAIQIAGFGNFSHDIEGIQISGFSNISSGTMKGAQIAGFINVAKEVNGVQIGVFNVADTVIKGIPIGFLSFVRNGFREFEFGISDGLNEYASFKIGVNQFYNIFSVGMQTFSDRFRWAYGYGIGTRFTGSGKLNGNIELMSYHINEDVWFTNAYNDLQQLKFTLEVPLSENAALFAGPTLNLMVSNYDPEPGQNTGSGFPPYHIYSSQNGRTNLTYWVGFNAGIRIH